jgi:phage tail-like protein
MATTVEDIKKNYPLPVFNFRVEIDKDTVAFSEVSGLSIQYETTTYKESPSAGGAAGPRVFHMPSQASPINITLKKGLVPAVSIGALYKWIKSVNLNRVEKKDIFVRLCDETGTAMVSWKILNAFPTKLDAPTFDASSNDAAVESMELRADSIQIEGK